MRIPVATILVAMLCACATATAQSAPPDSVQPASSTASFDPLNEQTPVSGIEVLSDTEGVDMKPFLQRWRRAISATWQRLAPKQLNAPEMQLGTVAIRFKILPSGQLMDGGMVLAQLSGQTPLDRAVWQTIASSVYPPLPPEFHGQYLELRVYFTLNPHPAQ
jgi:outer membrane biosynthesis protein TonB